MCNLCAQKMATEGCVPFQKWLDQQFGRNTSTIYALYPNAKLVGERTSWFAGRPKVGLVTKGHL